MRLAVGAAGPSQRGITQEVVASFAEWILSPRLEHYPIVRSFGNGKDDLPSHPITSLRHRQLRFAAQLVS